MKICTVKNHFRVGQPYLQKVSQKFHYSFFSPRFDRRSIKRIYAVQSTSIFANFLLRKNSREMFTLRVNSRDSHSLFTLLPPFLPIICALEMNELVPLSRCEKKRAYLFAPGWLFFLGNFIFKSIYINTRAWILSLMNSTLRSFRKQK